MVWGDRMHSHAKCVIWGGGGGGYGVGEVLGSFRDCRVKFSGR